MRTGSTWPAFCFSYVCGAHSGNGALARFGGFVAQPSETAKLRFLVMAAAMIARSEIIDLVRSVREMLKLLLAFCAPIPLIFLQPDLVSALTFPPMLFAMLYVVNLSQKFFIYVISCALILLSIVAFDIFGYHLFLDKHGLDPVNGVRCVKTSPLFP
jgi:rod shape determining protein RodA